MTIAELIAKGADSAYLAEMIGVGCHLVDQESDERATLVGFDLDPEFPVRVCVEYLDPDGKVVADRITDYRATHITVDDGQADALVMRRGDDVPVRVSDLLARGITDLSGTDCTVDGEPHATLIEGLDERQGAVFVWVREFSGDSDVGSLQCHPDDLIVEGW